MSKTQVEIPDFLQYKYKHFGTPWEDYKIELPDEKCFGTVVATMRANPLHKNHAAMLRRLCERSQHVKINVGSSNKFNAKNPFKAEERAEMMDRVLRGKFNNYELKMLPDVPDDEDWFNNLVKINEPFSEIISNNDYDLKIYKAHLYPPGHQGSERHRKYDILFPTDVLGKDEMVYVSGIRSNGKYVQLRKPQYASGTFIRAAMVNDWDWESLLDKEVAGFIKEKGLVARIKKLCPELKGVTPESFDDGR